jgi:hypothetical protein
MKIREMTTFNTKTNTLISTTCKATTTYTVNLTAIVTFLIFLFFSSAMFTAFRGLYVKDVENKVTQKGDAIQKSV